MGGGQLAVGDRVANRYEVLREIGKGAMGQVFLARDTKFKQDVALKVAVRHVGSNEELFRTRFEREARIGHHLGKTTGFVRALDWGETVDGRLYLAMDHVAKAGPLDIKGGSRTARLQQLLRAARLVAECHRQGIVHRDIKPTNFLVTPDGEVYLTDFGLAKTSDEADLPDALVDGAATQTGVAVGTPIYMPPEQFCDAKTADAKADVYALGVMLFRVLAGRPPFKTPISNLMLEQESVRRGKARAPNPTHFGSDASKALNDLAAKAVAIDPWKRPSAAELAEALEQELAYTKTLVDSGSGRRRRRGSSARQTAVNLDRRASSRRVRVDEAIRSYTPAPSRWDRWVKRLGRFTLLAVVIGVPLVVAGVVVADLGGVQARVVPKAWRAEIGNLTARLYAELPQDSVKQVDMTPPQVSLPRAAKQSSPDWTREPKVSLKVEVRDASLLVVRVDELERKPPEPRSWRSTFEIEVPLGTVGKHTVAIEAVDVADGKGRLQHEVWRVDPERFLVNVKLERTDEGVFVVGRLEPPLAIPLRVGEHSITSKADGTIRALVPVGDADQVLLKATSLRGDEVVEQLAVPSVEPH